MGMGNKGKKGNFAGHGTSSGGSADPARNLCCKVPPGKSVTCADWAQIYGPTPCGSRLDYDDSKAKKTLSKVGDASNKNTCCKERLKTKDTCSTWIRRMGGDKSACPGI